ncbi:hypothetical protein [Xanthomonas cannabis]|uniref:hypothetical protein n=1 Tax=Xanthomonas cannabis TaxID=1885674 RepID=UPI001111DA00|nr:hypothetical protein [Xanthomonas cannabis]
MDIVVRQSMRADDIAEAVMRLAVTSDEPAAIKVADGSDFAGKAMVKASTVDSGRSGRTRIGSGSWPMHGANRSLTDVL